MYRELFDLTEPPFRLTPDPQFLYASKQHARAKAYMESTIWLADGFVVLTGEIGAGKTTLIESFLSELPEKCRSSANQPNPTYPGRVSSGATGRVRNSTLSNEESRTPCAN
jgi:type II secretory pathway predicted ATPase ExeA